MKTEAIYDAISGFDETYVSAADNSEAVRLSFRKNRTRKIKTIGTVCVCAVVVMATGWIGSQGWFGKKPPASQNTLVPQESTSVSDSQTTEQMQNQQTTVGEQSTTAPSTEAESRIPKTENPTKTVPTATQNRQEATTKAPQTDVPATTKAKETPTGSSVEPTSVEATTVVNPKKPQYKDVVVDYEMAKTYFTHPIVPCKNNGFTGYNVLLYNSNGNFNEQGTKCLSVTYLFTNGSIVLNDQDKTGKVTPSGTPYEYQGRTFYVHTPEFNGDQFRIGYFPTGGSGIAYQAHFNSSSNVNEIMDLILSLEI